MRSLILLVAAPALLFACVAKDRDASTGPVIFQRSEQAVRSPRDAILARQIGPVLPGNRLSFIDPAFIQHSPALQFAAATGASDEHPFVDRLRDALADYQRRWGDLPQTQLPAAEPLGPGDRGTAVLALRHRLGLPARTDSFDERLERAVSAFQTAHGLSATGMADLATLRALNAGAAHYEWLIRLNLDRARALPPPEGSRFILVDVASARLWLYERGRPRDTMRVIVGKHGLQTPTLAGMLSFVALNPYWNMPPDLVRDRLAQHVLQEGPAYVPRHRYEILSDWSETPRRLDPRKIDWKAVAAGRTTLRVRQLPGADNMMGRIKFMMPNPLGIYLHDTPNKELFALADRRQSSGCIRVEDADRLSRWLFDGREIKPTSTLPEQRVDLPEPVPVYVTYLTALPGEQGIEFQPDVYDRDGPLLAELKAATTRPGPASITAVSDQPALRIR